jgi:outer membrane protein assembly factor BamB
MPAPTAAPLAKLDDSTVVLASPEGSLHAVRLSNGSILWSARTGEPISGAPVVVGDTVFALSRSCTIFRVPRHAGDVSRRDVIPDCISTTSPLILRDGVLVATVGGEITYISRATGSRVWTRRVNGPLRHPPVVLDRQAVIATLGGEVFGFR